MAWYTYDSTSSTDTSVWSTWTSSTADASTNTTSTCSGAWTSWNTLGSTCTANSSSTVTWKIWSANQNDKYYSIETTRKKTKAEKREEENRLKRYARERKEKEAKAKALEEEKKKAELRAKDLLLDLIGSKELAIYNETGRLFVKGHKFDYIIQKSGYIKQIDKEKITDLCVHLDNRFKFPETDNVVAMKLAIENDEDGILKLANKWGTYDRPKELLKAACM